MAASTLHPSARGRAEHEPSVRLRLASKRRRKLARSVGASCVCNQMCIICTVVSQARPHKSVNTHLVPQAGRSSVNRDRMPTAGVVGASWLLRAKGKHLQVPVLGCEHSLFECWRQSQAHTLSPLLSQPRREQHAPSICLRLAGAETTTHLQSASASNRGVRTSLLNISRSFVAALFQRQAPAGAWSWRQALCTRTLEAATSTHLQSASASHH